MIKKVTTREFSRYFSKHRLSDIDVTSNGEVVGHWRVNDKDSVSELAESLRGLMANHKEGEAMPNGVVDMKKEHTVLKCDKCNDFAIDIYKIWEEGEEHATCLACIKKAVPSKGLKSYLRKLEKL